MAHLEVHCEGRPVVYYAIALQDIVDTCGIWPVSAQVVPGSLSKLFDPCEGRLTSQSFVNDCCSHTCRPGETE